MLAALDRSPPDYVAVVQHDTAGMGARFFGRDYGQRLMAWVMAHYREVRVFGARPNLDNRFGILLMERAPGNAEQR